MLIKLSSARVPGPGHCDSRDIPLAGLFRDIFHHHDMTHSRLPSQGPAGWVGGEGLWESKAGSSEWGERYRLGGRGSPSTIPGSQDAEGGRSWRETHHLPLCTWPRATRWATERRLATVLLQSPQPWVGERPWRTQRGVEGQPHPPLRNLSLYWKWAAWEASGRVS